MADADRERGDLQTCDGGKITPMVLWPLPDTLGSPLHSSQCSRIRIRR